MTSTDVATTAAPGPAVAPAGRTRRGRRFWTPGTVLAAAVLLLVLVAVLAPGLLTGADPQATDPLASLQGPSAAHWFGTDQLGRDLYARVVHGARYSVTIAALAVLLAVTLGTLLGLVAGLGGARVDEVVARTLDLLSAFPSVLLALVLAALAGPGTLTLAAAVGVAAAPGFGRVVRRQTLAVRRSDFVRAAVTFGRPRRSVVAQHVLPHVLTSVLLLASIEVGTALLTVSGLSFVGLGPERPAPEWGSLLAEGRDVLALAWWPTVFPGVAVVATILAVTALGRRLQRVASTKGTA
ncbi:MAG TPA: ABC transporter permease [Cellulomonas sp.]